MSRTVDQRVVEMQFDNKQFERNVSTTMSTLDKLKQKLNFSGASKGLESVNTAAKNVNMGTLGTAVESVRTKFSALEVMGVTALANITNSAVNAGKRIVSSLTIDPVKTGLSEYETKMNAIQTMMANSRGQYSSTEEQMAGINAALEDLNLYADKTIYNFAQMTSNVGKFMAQGFSVDDAANAVKGLANLAAASGASAEDMARATYQMSQAMGASIKLMDWNSLRNANMATQDLKDTLIALAKVHGIAIDEMIEQEGTFEYTLQNGWLTGEMFTEAMNIYSGVYSEAELAAKGFTQSQIDNFMDLAKTAESAATEVKTFTQLWDVLKETAQSGWTQTWEIVFGDFVTAKDMFTKLQVYFSDIINRFSDARNFLLDGALNFGDPWSKIMDKLSASGLGKIKDVVDTIENAADKVKYFQDIVNDVWRGDYKRSDTGRYQLLEAAGYNHKVVQDLVNLGYGHKITIEDIEASHKKFGLILTKTAETTEVTADVLANLTDEQLRNAGLTEAEIKLYHDLAKEAERTGVSIGELVEKMSKKDGRTLLIESFKNAWQGLTSVLGAVKDAWVDIFPPMSVVQLYNIIDAINRFSENLKVGGDTAEKLKRTFKGLFALVDIIGTLFGGGLKIAFEVVKEVLSYFNLDILEATASIGDAIVAFRDWLDSILDVKGAVAKAMPFVEKLVKGIGEFVDKVKDSETFKRFSEYLHRVSDGMKKLFGNIKGMESFENLMDVIHRCREAIREWWDSLKDSKNIPADIIAGLVNGLKNGVPMVISAIVGLAKELIAGFCEVLGIQSPSKLFMTLGGFIIAGLILGILDSKTGLFDTIKDVAVTCFDSVKEWFNKISTSTGEFWVRVGELMKTGVKKVSDFLKGVDWGALIATGFGIGMLVLAYKITDVFKMLASPFEGLGDILENVAGLIEDLGDGLKKYFKAKAFAQTSKAILNMAIAIGILAASVWVLSEVDSDDLWRSVGAVAALAGVVAALATVSVLLNKLGNFGGQSLAILGFTGGLLILAVALERLAKIDAENVPDTLKLLGGMVLGMAAMMAIFGIFCKGASAKYMNKAGFMLLKVAAAMMIMVKVVDLASKLDLGAVKRGLTVVTALGVLFAVLIAVSKLAGQHASKAGTMLLMMSAAFAAMLLVIKLAAMLDRSEVNKGLSVIAVVGLLFTALIAVSKLSGANSTKAGAMLLMMSAAMLIITLIIKQVAQMDAAAIEKGLKVIAAVGIIFGAIIAVSKLAGEHASKAGVMLLAMSGAVLILTGVMWLLSKFDPSALGRSLAAVSLLVVLMGGLIAVTNLASNVKMGVLIVLVAGIAVLATAVALLSLIDPTNLQPAVLGLTMVIVAFGLLMAATKLVSSIKLTELLPLLAVVVVLTAVVAGLSLIDSTSAIPNVAALSILLLAFSGAMVILSTIKNKITGMTGTLALMTGVIVALAAVVYGLSTIEDPQTAIQMTGTLVVLLTAFTAVTAVLSAIGTGNGVGNAAKGAAALSAVVGIISGLVVLIGSLVGLIGEGWMSTIETGLDRFVGMMEKMGVLILAFIPVTAALSALGALGGIATATSGAVALDAVIAIIGALAVALGSLMGLFTDEFFTTIETGLDRFTSIMTKIGEAIGGFVGGVLGGLAEGALAAIGEGLTAFMENAKGFIDGCREIDETVLAGAGYLAAAIAVISAADLIASFADLFDFGPSLPKLGSDLSAFMNNAKDFISGAAAIDATMMEGIKVLAEAIIILSAANVLDGLVRLFGGQSSLASFGEQLPGLGTNLSSFATNLGTFGEDQIATVKCAANAIKEMAAAADQIPNEGGWIAKLVGDNSIATFGAKLPALGLNLKAFATNLGTFGEDQINTVTCAANAIKSLAQAASEIPNEGGWAAKILGDNSISTFGAKLPALGLHLKAFATNLGTFGEDQIATVTCAAKAVKEMAAAADLIPNEGGWVAKLIGDNSLATFGSKLPALGTYLKSFAVNLGTFGEDQIATVKCASNAIKEMAAAASNIDGQADWAKKIFGDNSISTFSGQLPTLGTNLSSFAANLGTFGADQIRTVSSAVSAIRAFADLADTNLKSAKNNVDDFGEKLPDLGEDIAGFCDNMPASETITTAINNLKKVMNIVKDMAAIDSSAAADFVDSLEDIGKDGVDGFVKAFTSETAKTDVKAAAKKLADKAVEGIEDKEDDIEDAADDLADAGADKLDTQANKTAWKDAGKALADGFADGISANTFKAEAKAAAMAEAAIEAARVKLDINSPSKVFTAMGAFVPEGFALGISKLGNVVRDAAVGMADTAINGLRGSITRISAMVDNDIDAQPTIRPVMDLSDVRTGVNAIGDMMNMGASVGVLANVNGISSSMNARLQNGSNSDVVSAINKLAKGLGNIGGNTYNVNGVTYDDGSNITQAIETIVREARIERRR